MRYLVIASCEDARSGAEFKPGDEFLPEPDLDQAARLVKAGCLRLIDDDAPVLPIDGREGVLVTQLRGEIAALTDELVSVRHGASSAIEAANVAHAATRDERDHLLGRVDELEGQIAAAAKPAEAAEQSPGDQSSAELSAQQVGDDQPPAKSGRAKG